MAKSAINILRFILVNIQYLYVLQEITKIKILKRSTGAKIKENKLLFYLRNHFDSFSHCLDTLRIHKSIVQAVHCIIYGYITFSKINVISFRGYINSLHRLSTVSSFDGYGSRRIAPTKFKTVYDAYFRLG